MPLTPAGFISLISPQSDPANCIVIYAHGFGATENNDKIQEIVSAYLGKGGYTVIVVLWVEGAASSNYLAAVNNAQKVNWERFRFFPQFLCAST